MNIMTEIQITIKVPSENVSISSGEADRNAPAPESLEKIESGANRSDTEGPAPSMNESSGGGEISAEDGGSPKPESIDEIKTKKKKNDN